MTLPTSGPPHTAGPTHRISGRDRLRRDWFLARLELWLDDYPRKRRRAVLDQLRADIDDDAALRGMPAALRALGRPRALAREYLATEPGDRPRWSLAAVVVAGLLGTWFLTTAIYAFGMIAALLATGGGSASSAFLGVELSVVGTDSELSVEFMYTTWVPLAVLALVFVAVARPWRAWKRRAAGEPAVS